MRLSQLRVFLLGAVLAGLSRDVVAAEINEIYVDLVTNGVTLSDDSKATLPKPVMTDGLDAAAQQKVMAGLVQPAKLAGFRGGNLNDWHELKISGSPAVAANQSSARNLDLYYVANGMLETVANQAFLKAAMGGGGNNFHILTAQELAAEGVAVAPDTKTRRERYAHAKMDLFNMAKVRATGHGLLTLEKDSLLIAFQLDPKFAKSKDFPNQWEGILMGPVGKVVGPPQPYQGAGGYMKVTRLVGGASPQIFIEYHLVFDEPFGWFNGKPVLTSKLPEKIRADVRSFRRDIQKFKPAVAAAPPAKAAGAAPAIPAGADVKKVAEPVSSEDKSSATK